MTDAIILCRFEDQDVTEPQLRGLIWDQLRRFHSDVGEVPPAFSSAGTR